MDWGHIQVHIASGQQGGAPWVVRVPCFLECVPDRDGAPRATVMLRDRIYGRVVGVLCGPAGMEQYRMFAMHAVEAASEDGSLFDPCGRLYAAVVGILVASGPDSIVVRTDVPGGGYMLAYAHD